jgi:Tol biopolymer transport system component
MCARSLLFCVALVLAPLGAEGQVPNEDWRTIHTEHFRVTFPKRLESLGRRAADRSERAWRELAEHFIEPPDDVIDVLVTDHTDAANGFAQVTPSNRITVFARPPTDALSLGHLDEWMELVITHELAHIVHLDHVTNPIGVAARAVFGRVSSEWPFFPELGTPRWITEGLATWYESRLTDAGRVRGTFQEMEIRTAILEGRFERIDQASGDSPLWPGGNRPYAYGSLFFDFLVQRHGEDQVAAFADAIAGQWIPYRINSAGRDAFGVSLSDEWTAWEQELEEGLADLDSRLLRHGPVSDPERLTVDARWGQHPLVSPDGRSLVYTRSDGRSDIQIRLRDLESGADRGIGRTNGLATYAWTPGGRLLVSQLEFRDPYRTFRDLYLFDLEGGQERLTEGARLGQPSVSPNGLRAVAVQQGDGTNAVVRVDMESGEVSELIAPDPDVHWAFPRYSPNGRWIVATRWQPEANHDLVVLDAETGDVVDRVTADRALDLAASWSPDGRWIVWSSDRTGVLNVLGAAFDPATGSAGEPVLLTNVRTGAAYPSVDPSGAWLYFSGYHVDGWEIERLPFNPGDGVAAPPAVARFAPSATPPARGASTSTMQGYSSAPTLGPKYWEVTSSEPIVTPARTTSDGFLRGRELLDYGIGFQTSGTDLVGRHSWAAVLQARLSGGELEGGLSYSYHGLGNPILSLSVNQDYADGGQQLTASLDTLFVLERERRLNGAMSFLLPRWRRNFVFTLSGGMAWEKLDLLDVALQPATAYRLPRTDRRVANVRASINVNTSRSHSFQMGTTRGINIFLQGRLRNELSLPDSLVGVIGADRSVADVLGRIRGAIPLWGGGFAKHVLAVQATGGVAGGPGSNNLPYRVGGASGRPEPVTGLELFGGRFEFFPVRGYDPQRRFGKYAWTASAEYRFPLWLVNRGLGAWPLHVDRAIGSVFFDIGNTWGPDVLASGFPNPLQRALMSLGVEMTTELMTFFDIQVRVRGGVAVPLVEGDGARVYARVGLPY